VLKLAADSELRRDIPTSTPLEGLETRNGGRLSDIQRGRSQCGAREVHHRVQSRRVLVLESQGVRQTGPVRNQQR
jgi:hypothetical protein